MIEVIKPGLLDMVMDLGRAGFRSQGVPAGGAADALALIMANRLVGNPDDAAGLEMTQVGSALRFVHGGVAALTGADMGAFLDNQAVSSNQRLVISPGSELRLGRAKRGLRGYLAVAGGIDVPLVLGSRSTFLPGGFGGYQGRALRGGDVLDIGDLKSQLDLFQPGQLPAFLQGDKARIRILPGPQIADFADAALATLVGRAYRVLADSNRMGIRILGETMSYRGQELASQGVLPGAIQVPPDGQPITLGWDGPVTGGYPVIAGVISADLSRLAQLCPGDAIRFEFVTRLQAIEAWRVEMGLVK